MTNEEALEEIRGLLHNGGEDWDSDTIENIAIVMDILDGKVTEDKR